MDKNGIENFVDLIRDMIGTENSKRDTTVLCQIKKKVDDAHYDVAIMPDDNTIVHSIPNMTNHSFNAGDYVYIYKIGNSLNNSFICHALSWADDTSVNDLVANPGSSEEGIEDLSTIMIKGKVYRLATQGTSSGGTGARGPKGADGKDGARGALEWQATDKVVEPTDASLVSVEYNATNISNYDSSVSPQMGDTVLLVNGHQYIVTNYSSGTITVGGYTNIKGSDGVAGERGSIQWTTIGNVVPVSGDSLTLEYNSSNISNYDSVKYPLIGDSVSVSKTAAVYTVTAYTPANADTPYTGTMTLLYQMNLVFSPKVTTSGQLEFERKTVAEGLNPVDIVPSIGTDGLWKVGETSTGTKAQGRGISDITKTSSSGLVDTYTITYDDGGTTQTYEVTNGKAGAAGKDGAMVWQTTETAGQLVAQGDTIPYTQETFANFLGSSTGRVPIIGDMIIDYYGYVHMVISTATPVPYGSTVTQIRGTAGRGITKIEKTASEGLVDTYTITYTDSTTSTFTVTNGSDAEVTADNIKTALGYTPADAASIKTYKPGTGISISDDGTISLNLTAAETLEV